MKRLLPLLLLSLLCVGAAGYAQRATPPPGEPKAEGKPKAEEKAQPAEKAPPAEKAEPTKKPAPAEKERPKTRVEERSAFEGCVPTDQLTGIPEGLAGRGEERKKAREQLAERGEEAIPDLIRATRACNNTIRWEAVNALGNLRAKQGMDALIERVLTDLDPHVEWRSIWALGCLRADDEIRKKGLEALRNAADESQRWRAAILLSNFKEPECVPVLHEGLKADSEQGKWEAQWVKWEAVNALGRVHNEDSVEALRPLAKDPSGRIRQEVALVFGRMREPEGLPVLIAMLNDEDANVRWRAAMAMGSLGLKEGIEPLKRRLEQEEDDHTKEVISKALERLSRPERKPLAKPPETKKPAAEEETEETKPAEGTSEKSEE